MLITLNNITFLLQVDRVFKDALLEFKDNLVATYSIVETGGSALKYKDLIGNFLHVMETVCAREGSTLSITMGVNAFRGFMDEFMSQHDTNKARTKQKKDKKRKVSFHILFLWLLLFAAFVVLSY